MASFACHDDMQLNSFLTKSSLIPSPIPAFQCCTLKSGKVWSIWWCKNDVTWMWFGLPGYIALAGHVHVHVHAHATAPSVHYQVHPTFTSDLQTCLISTFATCQYLAKGFARGWIRWLRRSGDGGLLLCWRPRRYVCYLHEHLARGSSYTWHVHACAVHGACIFVSNAAIGQLKLKFWHQSCSYSISVVSACLSYCASRIVTLYPASKYICQSWGLSSLS